MSTPEGVQAPPGEGERRSGVDRRATGGRRAADRAERFRSVAATLVAFAGGLSVLFLFFAAVGAVDLGDALVATIAALVLALIWLAGVYQRYRSGAGFVTRQQRERRGF